MTGGVNRGPGPGVGEIWVRTGVGGGVGVWGVLIGFHRGVSMYGHLHDFVRIKQLCKKRSSVFPSFLGSSCWTQRERELPYLSAKYELQFLLNAIWHFTQRKLEKNRYQKPE